MSTDLTTYVSAEEYLERERAATNSKSEWIDGEIREMAGAKLHHVLICANLVAMLHAQLKGRPFLPCPSDIKIRIPDGPYYYPDVSVVPDPPEFEDGHEDVVRNPLVVVEILSPSTEEADRGRKLDDYRRIPSLRDYVLVDQFEPRVDHYAITEDGWGLRIVEDLEGSIILPSIGCELRLADVYERVAG